MDIGKQMASGATVIAPGAPSSHHVAPRAESELGTSHMASPAMSRFSERKKRGRPRKYKPDESSSRVFSSMQISSSAPPGTDKAYMGVEKTGITQPVNSERKLKSKIGAENLDEWLECSTGSSFFPHAITINTGEDIYAKIVEFAQQGPRAVCIVSGSGMVSNVTLRLPNSSGGCVTYEGLFEILSFSGSFTPLEVSGNEYGGRSGTMTITISGPNCRAMGGLIAGLTTAASPVKVVVTSFLLSSPHELKPKKQYTFNEPARSGISDSHVEKRSAKNLQGSNYSSFDNPTNLGVTERSRNSALGINISLQG